MERGSTLSPYAESLEVLRRTYNGCINHPSAELGRSLFIKGWQVPGVEVPPPNKRFLKVVMSPEVTGTQQLTLLYSIIGPGYTTGVHTHDVDEFQYVATGRGESTVGEEKSLVEMDTVIHAPAGVSHEVRNTGDETLKLICFFVPPLKPAGYFEKAIEAAKKASR